MKNAFKAALFSGLVFPGLGHLVLGKVKRGVGIMLLTLAGLVAFIVKACQTAVAVVEKLQAEGGILDAESVSAAAARSVDVSASLALRTFFLLIMACWLYGAVDAYFLGRRRDMENETSPR